jgi:asparagine synthase (glutamine-hydrolysing)
MPGIFGVVDLSIEAVRLAADRLDIVRAMAAGMTYEADYGSEIVDSPTLGVSAGWVGRSSPSPMRHVPSKMVRRVLITAGEPYVSGTIEAAACHGIGSGAEAVGSLLCKRGVGALSEINGIFAGCFIDQDRGQCVIFNDRYGIERLFVHMCKERVFFSSEAKAILAVADSARALDAEGLAEWLTCGSTIGRRSLFRDVEILAGGTAITFSPGREAVRTPYFDRTRLEQLPELPADEFLDQFDSTFAKAATHALARSPRAALSLTGGLDSRLVLAAAEAAPDTLACYTFGSMFRTTGDVAVARAVASACSQSHQELTLDARFLTDIDSHLRQAVYVSDGYLGFSGSAELYLNRQARTVAPARVTGNWGGELMRGVRAFKFQMPKGDFTQPSLITSMTGVGKSFGSAETQHPLSFTLFQQAPHQGYGRYAIERSQVLMRSPFLDNDVVRALYQAPVETRTSSDLVHKVLTRRPELAAIPTDIGRLGRGPSVVREMRHAYRKAIVKAEYLTSHGAPNWMAALSNRLPLLQTAFLGRDKFQHFRLWTRNQLAPLVREILGPSNRTHIEPWFDPGRVATMVDDHVAGRGNYTEELDKIITVVLVDKTLIGGARTSLPRSMTTRPRELLVAPGMA